MGCCTPIKTMRVSKRKRAGTWPESRGTVWRRPSAAVWTLAIEHPPSGYLRAATSVVQRGMTGLG